MIGREDSTLRHLAPELRAWATLKAYFMAAVPNYTHGSMNDRTEADPHNISFKTQ